MLIGPKVSIILFFIFIIIIIIINNIIIFWCSREDWAMDTYLDRQGSIHL